MGIFDRIARLISDDKSQNPEPEVHEKNTIGDKVRQGWENLDNNSIAVAAKIIECVEKKLDQAYKGKKVDFSKKNMVLWITESLLYETLNTDDYKANFRLSLSQEGYDFNNFEFRCEQLLRGNTFTKITDSVFMQIAEETVAPAIIHRKARITLAPGSRGSLKANEYILDSQHLPQGDRFNIGRGTNPFVGRTNYIVIDENLNHDVNDYISRNHATIRFSPTSGFCLFVEKGTYQNGSRTRIFRQGEPKKDLTTPEVPNPLKDGDIIELAKVMTLLFEELPVEELPE